MSVRKFEFTNGDFCHIFNRGVDKRDIFLDRDDIGRFLKSMEEFNTTDPIGSIYENSFTKNKKLRGKASKSSKLVNFICYCLNPNHFHFILEQVSDKGIEKFMHKLGTGYTMYFNNKNDRSGSLFQGKFKAVYLSLDDQLLNSSVYVNLNNEVHQLRGKASQLIKSSWDEYVTDKNNNFCRKDIILEQFNSTEEYKKFAEDSLEDIKEKKDMEKLLLE
ncbi:MAG: transposase [Candidatus Paceibacteria bacterium]